MPQTKHPNATWVTEQIQNDLWIIWWWQKFAVGQANGNICETIIFLEIQLMRENWTKQPYNIKSKHCRHENILNPKA